MDKARKRAQMPKGSSSILNQRSLEKDYSTLVPLLQKGMNVLDVGCGSGAISAGIACKVGTEGRVVGIDRSEHLIAEGKGLFKETKNLELIQSDLFSFDSEEKFDLIVSARVLQWLKNPKEALRKMKTLLKSDGYISILDYNHTALEWHPQPPQSMLRFYQAFLDWRTDAGMNNQISEDLPTYFEEVGLKEVEVLDANEIYEKGVENFHAKAGIWTKVAESRGLQLQEEGYTTEKLRIQAITEYNEWVNSHAKKMIMKLKEIRGRML